MNYNKQKLTTIGTILIFVLIATTQIINIVNEKNRDEFPRTSYSYDAEEEAKIIKHESWDSVYLPSTLPNFYSLEVTNFTDTSISCEFYRITDTGFAKNLPHIYFTQWNTIKETIPTEHSNLPPILKTGKVQSGSEDESEEQIEINTNATLQPQTYNGKEYYFSDETPNSDLLLLWYKDENTFTLKFHPGKGNKSNENITLHEMLEIADQVKNYS